MTIVAVNGQVQECSLPTTLLPGPSSVPPHPTLLVQLSLGSRHISSLTPSHTGEPVTAPPICGLLALTALLDWVSLAYVLPVHRTRNAAVFLLVP